MPKIELAKTTKKLETVDNSEKLVTRSLRSSEKKSQISVQETVPKVEPVKTIVKRIDFVKLTTFQKDSIVLAKQKYSYPWPPRVLNIEKDKVLVHFFGDSRTGFVSSFEIYDYGKSFEALKSIVLLKKKPRGFLLGIREIELLLEVNGADSVLNTI